MMEEEDEAQHAVDSAKFCLARYLHSSVSVTKSKSRPEATFPVYDDKVTDRTLEDTLSWRINTLEVDHSAISFKLSSKEQRCQQCEL